MALSKGIRAGIALGMLPEQLEHARLENEFTKGRVKQLEAANKLAALQIRNTQGVQSELAPLANHRRPQQHQFSPEDLAQIERLKPIAQPAPASQPRTDAQRIEAFARQFNPQYAQQLPMQGPHEQPIMVEKNMAPLVGPDMLRDVGLACLKHGQGQEGMVLLTLADDQRKTQEMGSFYQSILASRSGDPQLRSQAMAGLGALMLAASKTEQAMEILKKTLPPTVLELIEKTTGETKNLLLGQLRQGRTPNIARGQRVKTAKAEAHAKRAMFEAQPRQTAAEAGITTTASGERVRTTQPTEHGSR